MGYPRLYGDPRIVKTIGLWYDDINNWFVDEEGFVVHHLWWYITPDEFKLFKLGRKDRNFRCATNITIMVELFWPEAFMIEILRDAREHREKRLCPYLSDKQLQFQWERESKGQPSMGFEYLVESGKYESVRE